MLRLSRQQVVYGGAFVVFTAALLSQVVAGTAPGIGWQTHRTALAAPGTLPGPTGTIPPHRLALPYVAGGGGGTIPPADLRMFLPLLINDSTRAD